MKRTTLITALLLAILAGEGFLASRQHAALVEKRDAEQKRAHVAAMALKQKEERVRALEEQLRTTKAAVDLKRAQLKNGHAPSNGASAENVAAGGKTAPARQASAVSRPPFAAAMEDPEFRKFVATRQRERSDELYGEVFRRLNLPPDKLEALKDLLVEKQQALGDASWAARDVGYDLNNIPGNLKAVRYALGGINDEIKQLVGPEAYAELSWFDESGGARAMVDRVATTLSYSAEPLTPDQGRRLAGVILDRTPLEKRQFASGYGAQVVTAVVLPNYRAPIPDEAIVDAQAFLSPLQVEALRQVKARYDAEELLHRLKR
jgi:hypothetical protein